MSKSGLEKAIAPFSCVLISSLFLGNLYFVREWGVRVESKIDSYESRLDEHGNRLTRLETLNEQEKKKCSKKSSKS